MSILDNDVINVLKNSGEKGVLTISKAFCDGSWIIKYSEFFTQYTWKYFKSDR